MLNAGLAIFVTAAVWLGVWEVVKWRWQARGSRTLFVTLILILSISLLIRDHENRAMVEAWFDFVTATGLLVWLLVD